MNRTITQHTLSIDENNGRSESRVKLNTRGFLFLSVVVLGDRVIASFEEETVGGGANVSLFIYRSCDGDVQLIHNPSQGEHLATFVHNNEICYLYGKRTNRQ